VLCLEWLCLDDFPPSSRCFANRGSGVLDDDLRLFPFASRLCFEAFDSAPSCFFSVLALSFIGGKSSASLGLVFLDDGESCSSSPNSEASRIRFCARRWLSETLLVFLLTTESLDVTDVAAVDVCGWLFAAGSSEDLPIDEDDFFLP